MFPAASVSRLNWFRVLDSAWQKGTVTLARKYQAPVLPVFIDAKNSWLFYAVSLINKKLSSILLAHELFNKQNKTIRIKIGDVIPAKVFAYSYINDKYQIRLLKKHVYLMGKKDRTVYATEKNIIHPVERRLIKRELNNSKLLSLTNDGMQIFLTSKNDSPYSLNEIARLREITFRKVGEGTGKKLDLDKFDSIYSHLVFWDDKELEIVGSYRVGMGDEIFKINGINGFYTSTLFNFTHEFEEMYLKNSIELGRSFVQKKYWNTNALNYLWLGIGALLAENDSYKYLFGGVSISNGYPEYAKELIIYYYKKWYGSR
jgi:putative hemolysin